MSTMNGDAGHHHQWTHGDCSLHRHQLQQQQNDELTVRINPNPNPKNDEQAYYVNGQSSDVNQSVTMTTTTSTCSDVTTATIHQVGYTVQYCS